MTREISLSTLETNRLTRRVLNLSRIKTTRKTVAAPKAVFHKHPRINKTPQIQSSRMTFHPARRQNSKTWRRNIAKSSCKPSSGELNTRRSDEQRIKLSFVSVAATKKRHTLFRDETEKGNNRIEEP